MLSLIHLISLNFVLGQEPVWTDCSQGNTKFECTTLQVPMDYDNPNSPKIGIAINKYAPANATKYTLVNPGGPGESGLEFLNIFAAGFGQYLHKDLIWIGFDPRGIGQSNPVSCGTSQRSEFDLYFMTKKQYLDGTSNDIEADAIAKFTAQECKKHSGELLRYVSTYHVARDMEEIRKFLKMDTMRYWGFSYGSVLGNTYANMFPEKAANMVVDGVVNPLDYYGTAFDFLRPFYSKVSDALLEFARLCDAASSKACALSRPGESSFNRLMDIVKKLEKEPMVVQRREGKTVLITKDAFLNVMYQAVRGADWAMFASIVADLENGDGVLFSYRVPPPVIDPCVPLPISANIFANTAVLCADGTPLPSMTFEQRRQLEISVGANFTAEYGVTGSLGFLPCLYWNKTSEWKVYNGPWNKKLARPALVVGTTFDAVTPLTSAISTVQLMNQGHDTPNAVLLTHNGIGHCTLGQFSQCALNAIQEYLANDVLPAPNTTCESDAAVFQEPPADGSKKKQYPSIQMAKFQSFK